MVAKSYLRYIEGPDSGVVTSAASNSMAILPKPASSTTTSNNNSAAVKSTSSSSMMMAVVAALEYVAIYDLQSGQLLDRLCPKALELGSTAEVTSVTTSFVGSNNNTNNINNDLVHIAVGYANGCISMWSGAPASQNKFGRTNTNFSNNGGNSFHHQDAALSASFEGNVTSGYNWTCAFYGQSHKPDTAVLSVSLDIDGGRLLSAGQDTDLTLWDLATHEPLYRLCGHRGAVVNAVFVPNASSSGASNQNRANAAIKNGKSSSFNTNSSADFVISGSADGLLKVWDLSVQACVETVVASDTQVTSICVDRGGQRVFAGVRDDHIKVFAINNNTLNAVGKNSNMVEEPTTITFEGTINVKEATSILVPHGLLRRKTNKPPTTISFSPDAKLLLVVSAQNVELYKVLTSEEVQKKVQRKLRRKKETEKRQRQQQEQQQQQQSAFKKRRGDNINDDNNNNNNENDENNQQQDQSIATKGSEWQRTVNEEFIPLRLFSATNVDSVVSASSTDGHNNHKIRSALLLPASSSATATTSIRFLVASNDNTLSIMETTQQEQQPQETNDNNNEDGAAATTTVLSDWKKIRDDIGGQQHHSHQHEIRRLIFDSSDMQLASVSQDCVKLWFISSAAAERNESRMERINQEAWDDGSEEQRGFSRLVCAATFAMNDLHTMCVSDEVMKTGFFPHLEGSYNASVSTKNRNALAFHATNVCFLPGDDIIAISTLEGRLIVCGVSTNTVISVVNAHTGQINDFVASKHRDWFVTCGKDRRVTKWKVALNAVAAAAASAAANNSANGNKSNNNNRNNAIDPMTCTTLEAAGDEAELNDIPLTLRLVPPNDEIIAVALQDFTVHLYYCDTFKPFLTLYGHKLPVNSIAFSVDGQLCSTVGMDKSLRFWGTDFGDCHRSIHAHDNYVNGVAFLGHTHYVVTVSLDGSVKFWDGDTWQLIQQFHVHQRGLLCVSSNRDGTCIATAGADRNIRVLFRTDEMLFPDEELAHAAQKAADQETARRAAMKRLDQVEVGDVGIVGQKTVSTAEAAEHLMTALDNVSVEIQRRVSLSSGEMAGNAPFEMANQDPYVYFWKALEQIKPSQLRHALSSITQTHMHSLLQFLVGAVAEGAVQDYEIASRVVLALVKPSPGSNSNPSLLFPDPKEAHRVLANLGQQISSGLKRDTDRVAVNVAGLDFMLNRLEGQRKIKIHDRTKIQGAAKKFSNVELKALNNDD